MIRDHAWRPVYPTTVAMERTTVAQRPCQYLNCRRLRGEHSYSVSLRGEK